MKKVKNVVKFEGRVELNDNGKWYLAMQNVHAISTKLTNGLPKNKWHKLTLTLETRD